MMAETVAQEGSCASTSSVDVAMSVDVGVAGTREGTGTPYRD